MIVSAIRTPFTVILASQLPTQALTPSSKKCAPLGRPRVLCDYDILGISICVKEGIDHIDAIQGHNWGARRIEGIGQSVEDAVEEDIVSLSLRCKVRRGHC